VAGATGYIGDLLARELGRRGFEVRALARRPGRASSLADAGCEVVRADVLEPASLRPALEGSRVAYYLVHSMGRGAGADFAARDRRGARNFGQAAAAAGVGRIVYLGGLGGESGASEHLRSRHETALELAEAGVPLVYLRAAAVIGAGSESFRTVAYLVKRLPAMVTPKWTSVRTQPIAVDDVVSYLAQATEVDDSAEREVQIGGPEVTTYGGLMDEAARALGVRRRPRLSVPVLSPRLSSLWVGLVTPVDAGVARPLIEGLTTETIVTDPSGASAFSVKPTGLPEAMRRAVAGAFRGG
jgi:uncharacterized protein YbjT (DUF2867 family)